MKDEDIGRTGVEHDEPIARSNKRDGSTNENSVGKPRTVIGRAKSKRRAVLECMLNRILIQERKALPISWRKRTIRETLIHGYSGEAFSANNTDDIV